MKPSKTNSIILYTVVLIVLFMLGSAVFLFRSGVFNIKIIEVEGNQRVGQSDILRLAEYIKGKNIILVDQEELRRKVMLHPLLNGVQFQKRPPDTIIITITERSPLALVLVPKGVIEVDGQGVFLRRLEGWPRNDFPVINGIEVPDTAGPGQIMDDASLQGSLRLLNEAPAELLPLIGEVYVNQIQQITIFLISGVEVRLGQASVWEEKLDSLLQLLNDESYKTMEIGVKYIDFTASKPVIGFN